MVKTSFSSSTGPSGSQLVSPVFDKPKVFLLGHAVSGLLISNQLKQFYRNSVSSKLRVCCSGCVPNLVQWLCAELCAEVTRRACVTKRYCKL